MAEDQTTPSQPEIRRVLDYLMEGQHVIGVATEHSDGVVRIRIEFIRGAAVIIGLTPEEATRMSTVLADIATLAARARENLVRHFRN